MKRFLVEYMSNTGRMLDSEVIAEDEDDAVEKVIMFDFGPSDDFNKLFSVYFVCNEKDDAEAGVLW